MDNGHAQRNMVASARRLVDGSREMVAWSIARLIATNPILTGAASAAADILLKLLHSPCDFDVLVFAERHRRALLTIDDIARAVGHDPEDVRVSIETLTVAGLIARTKMRREDPRGDHGTGVLFYEFTPGTWDAIIPALCWVTASADGRRVLRHALLRTKARQRGGH